MTSCFSHCATASASASTPSSALSEAGSSSRDADATSRSSTPCVWAPVLRSGSGSRGSYRGWRPGRSRIRSEEHTSELQSLAYLVCRLLLEKKKKEKKHIV